MSHGRLVVVLCAVLSACAPEYSVSGLVGGDGQLRFNLQFTNESLVDLDLHVITPNGDEIYYAAVEDSTGGKLDVDCYCGGCPNGPNENVFWPYEVVTAPAGSYEVFIEYFGPCDLLDFEFPPSDYTLRILEGGETMQTYTGTLSEMGAQQSYSHTYGATETAE